jgi:hypothetical protein
MLIPDWPANWSVERITLLHRFLSAFLTASRVADFWQPCYRLVAALWQTCGKIVAGLRQPYGRLVASCESLLADLCQACGSLMAELWQAYSSFVSGLSTQFTRLYRNSVPLHIYKGGGRSDITDWWINVFVVLVNI